MRHLQQTLLAASILPHFEENVLRIEEACGNAKPEENVKITNALRLGSAVTAGFFAGLDIKENQG